MIASIVFPNTTGTNQRIPGSPVNDNVAGEGSVIARPILGGLHYDYTRTA